MGVVESLFGLPSNMLGWALLIEEPWAQVESPLLQSTLMAPMVMAPVLLLALLAASIDKVRTATIDVSKTYTNEFIHGR